MAKKETQKVKAEKLDKLREIFGEAYFIQLDDSKFEEFNEFVYTTLMSGVDISNASEHDEEVALVFSGEDIRDVLKILALEE